MIDLQQIVFILRQLKDLILGMQSQYLPNFESLVNTIMMSATGVHISEIEKKEKFLPVVSFKDNKLDVNVLLGNFSNITVKITDNEGDF